MIFLSPMYMETISRITCSIIFSGIKVKLTDPGSSLPFLKTGEMFAFPRYFFRYLSQVL